uniref:Putative secreted protein n=1 Tax=Ixodes ricinus TaxID=34613 RepID=A0A0K8R432_IXORI
MLRFMTLLLAASTFGDGATVRDFNDYVDRAVGSKLPPLIRNAHSLYPEARIPFHTFELSEEYVWQNDIEVRLTEGAVKGLDVVTERSGSCSHPSQVMGATVTTCTLDLSGLEATYSVQTNRGERHFC